MKNPNNSVSPLTMRVVITSILFLANGCLEPYAPALITEDYNILVIDGFLVSNDSTFIKLSRSQAIGDAAGYESEIRASVQIESDNGTKYLLSEKSKGLYVAPPLNLEPSLTYRLHIRTDDTKEYYSDFVPLKTSPSLDSVTWEETPSLDGVQFNVYAHDPENKTRYYLWEAEETWKYTSIWPSTYFFKNGEIFERNSSSEIYDCWKTSDINNSYLHSSTTLADDVIFDFKLFVIPQTSRKLYYGYSLLVKQYALTQEAYNYWTMIKKNSESLGTLFDPLPAQPFSNFRCVNNPVERVIGLFIATTVQKKRAFLTRKEITGPFEYDPSGYGSCDSATIRLNGISDITLQKLLIIEKRHNKLEPFQHIGYAVAHEDCIDCRKKGGVAMKPDYWD